MERKEGEGFGRIGESLVWIIKFEGRDLEGSGGIR